jgi:SAM-dependent methyltransferase
VPAPTECDDESYLDFVSSMRGFVMGPLSQAVKESATRALREFEAGAGRMPATIDENHEILDEIPVVLAHHRMYRTIQEMMWQATTESFRKREPELLRELEIADRSGPGSVEYDPNFRYPEYFSKVEFHLQPGSYHADPLAGYIYHYGTRVFFMGKNDSDDRQRSLAEEVPLPRDGRVERVLDAGSSCGQTTTAFRQRFPAADVWGIDAAAPMVRYAHKRAIEMGVEVHFAQRLVEDTRMPSDYFDILYADNLFHELPMPTIRQALAECYRILRPGGVFAVMDITNKRSLDREPAALLVDDSWDFNKRSIGEPYQYDFFQCDFSEMLRAVRFCNVVDDNRASFRSPSPFAMRVAEK